MLLKFIYDFKSLFNKLGVLDLKIPSDSQSVAVNLMELFVKSDPTIGLW